MTHQSREEIEKKANVIGTFLGPKRTNGAKKGTRSVIVLVTHKVPEDDLDEDDLIQQYAVVDGETIETDVQEAGGELYEEHQDRYRPVRGGTSIGTDTGSAGTVGSPWLQCKGEDVVVTNAHVVPEKRTSDAVYQPALLDGGTNADQFGTVLETSERDPNAINHTDSALISVDPDTVSSTIHGIGELVGFREATFTEHTKSGRTTGVTTGELRGRDGRVWINTMDGGRLLYEGVDLFDNMSDSGDSGSLIGILENEGFYGTDILFAGSSEVTIAIPLSTVQAEHGEFTIPSPAEPPESPSFVSAFISLIRSFFGSR